MAKFTHMTNLNGRIIRRGILRINAKQVGITDEEYAEARRRAGGDWTLYSQYADEVRRERTGNVTVLVIGEGAKDLGFNALTWFFVIDGRAYVRLPGTPSQQRGQYFHHKGKWHTKVRALRGRQRAAVLAAAATTNVG